MPELIRPPFHSDIPEPVMVTPPAEHLTSEGVYIPPSVRPHIRLNTDPDFTEIRHLHLLYDKHRVRRWMLPSWGWVGVRTYYGHSDAEWETFRRKIVGAYRVLEIDEADKFRILWIEDKEKLDGADDGRAREAFKEWFLEHSNPPDGHYSVIPTIKTVWSGYETMVCLVADKETIDSVLADGSDTLDETASIKLLERDFNEEDMRQWAPKLVGRYTGSFKVSPHYLPSLDGVLTDEDSYGQPGSPSTWYLRAAKTQDGVFRQRNKMIVNDEFGKDPVNLGEDSSDEDSDDSDASPSQNRDEL